MASRYKGSSRSRDEQNQMGLFQTPKTKESDSADKDVPQASHGSSDSGGGSEAPVPKCPRCGAKANQSLREPGKYYCLGFPACMEGDDIFRFEL